MNQAEYIRQARERATRRLCDGLEERVASRTPEGRARVTAIYSRFCEEYAAAKRAATLFPHMDRTADRNRSK